ncbi:MAG: hypothetical protein QM706_11980 [Nitrospira sp.]
MNYILDRNNQPVECDDMVQWAGWFDAASRDGRRIVAKTKLGHCEVSTVFLGIAYRHPDNAPPLLFEPMVFGIQFDGSQYRCCTWQEALWQHEQVCDRVRAMTAAQ